MISKHFARKEFACKCGCGFATVDVKLIELLELVREHFRKPVIITSGCRCAAHNKAEGGAGKSKHLEGMAVDFIVKDVPVADVHDFVINQLDGWGGVGKYPNFVHLDSRDEPARWEK